MAGLAVLVASLRPLARKAEDVKELLEKSDTSKSMDVRDVGKV